jgi:hypothetical protein
MKKLIGLLFTVISLNALGQVSLDVFEKRETYMNTITVKELKEQLFILAADDFEGRETSKPGQKKARLACLLTSRTGAQTAHLVSLQRW